MKVGDLVKVRSKPDLQPGGGRVWHDTMGAIGIITDCMEDETGFYHFEVVFPNDRGWYSDLELETVQDSCKIVMPMV